MSLRILIFLLFNSVVFCSCNISAAKSNKFINSVYQLTNLKFFLNQLGKSFEKQEKDWPDLRQTFRFLRPHTSLRYRGILEGPKTIRKYANLLSHNERKYTGSVESFDILRPPSNYSVFGVSNSCQHDMSVGVLNGFKLLMMLLDEERVLEMVGTSLRPVIEGLKDLKKLEEETVQAIITSKVLLLSKQFYEKIKLFRKLFSLLNFSYGCFFQDSNWNTWRKFALGRKLGFV